MSDKIVEITINQFADKGAFTGVQDCILQALIKVQSQAKTLAPVDLGQLRNSLMYELNKKDGGFNSESGKKADQKLTTGSDELVGYVGTNLDYAVYQEFGTRKNVAQPFLRPAGEAVKGVSAEQIAKKYGREAMEEEFKKRKVIKK